MPPYTKGFRPTELLQHFSDHGAEFGLTAVDDYVRLADALWIDPRPAHVEQCVRMGGDTVRFDTLTNAYGVVDNFNYIRTLFVPIPCATLTPAQRAAMRPGGCHNEPDNLSYFRKRCRG